MRRVIGGAVALGVVMIVACGSGSGSSPDGGAMNPDGSIANDGSTPMDAYVPPPYDGNLGTCLGASLLSELGKTHLLAGASMEDATAKAAPFDLRYTYLSGGFFDGNSPCTDCNSGCTAGGKSCVNGACNWWGCWQDTSKPPGLYARNFFATAQGDGQIPMITYYQILQSSGVNEGAPEVTQAATNVTGMTRYYADFRFLLQQIGTSVVVLHIEPDFWGYAEQVSNDPTSEAAAVATANSTDCAGQPNTIAGFGKCLIAMVRKYAPNARVGFHASAWSAGPDCGGNTQASLDVATYAQKTAAFLVACGADQSDFFGVEASDRDAGYYQSQGKDTWWDATNAKLPTFHQDFAWLTALAEAGNKPLIDWQLPVGNMSLPNKTNAWQDNRVDYFFAHPNELSAAHVVGFAFGAGAGDQTTPESDGGNLISKVKAYSTSGGQPLCQ